MLGVCLLEILQLVTLTLLREIGLIQPKNMTNEDCFIFNESYEMFKSMLLSSHVCYYYVTYEFQSELTLCSCLNVKEPFARNVHHI